MRADGGERNCDNPGVKALAQFGDKSHFVGQFSKFNGVYH